MPAVWTVLLLQWGFRVLVCFAVCSVTPTRLLAKTHPLPLRPEAVRHCIGGDVIWSQDTICLIVGQMETTSNTSASATPSVTSGVSSQNSHNRAPLASTPTVIGSTTQSMEPARTSLIGQPMVAPPATYSSTTQSVEPARTSLIGQPMVVPPATYRLAVSQPIAGPVATTFVNPAAAGLRIPNVRLSPLATNVNPLPTAGSLVTTTMGGGQAVLAPMRICSPILSAPLPRMRQAQSITVHQSEPQVLNVPHVRRPSSGPGGASVVGGRDSPVTAAVSNPAPQKTKGQPPQNIRPPPPYAPARTLREIAPKGPPPQSTALSGSGVGGGVNPQLLGGRVPVPGPRPALRPVVPGPGLVVPGGTARVPPGAHGSGVRGSAGLRLGPRSPLTQQPPPAHSPVNLETRTAGGAVDMTRKRTASPRGAATEEQVSPRSF